MPPTLTQETCWWLAGKLVVPEEMRGGLRWWPYFLCVFLYFFFFLTVLKWQVYVGSVFSADDLVGGPQGQKVSLVPVPAFGRESEHDVWTRDSGTALQVLVAISISLALRIKPSLIKPP